MRWRWNCHDSKLQPAGHLNIAWSAARKRSADAAKAGACDRRVRSRKHRCIPRVVELRPHTELHALGDRELFGQSEIPLLIAVAAQVRDAARGSSKRGRLALNELRGVEPLHESMRIVVGPAYAFGAGEC